MMELHPQLVLSSDVQDASFDAVVVVTDTTSKLTGPLSAIKEVIDRAAAVDNGIEKQPVLLIAECVPSKRLIYAATGPVNRDQDDVRRFADAAGAGIQRAISAGCKQPLLITVESDLYDRAVLVAVLGTLQKAYLPLELSEAGKPPKLSRLGIWTSNNSFSTKDVDLAAAFEKGRAVARDIGGSDPERMAAPRVEEYLRQIFKDSCVEMDVISDVTTLNKDFPLLGAVNRAANGVDRHKGRLIFLEYKGKGEISKTLFLVGKGITYDTGGADIKAGGIMAGMHRDKCGAAAVAGFMKVLSVLQPENLRVIAGLAMVRNSVGEESYVADEIICSRAGVRIRVGNTDAEGRMVMSDVLCRMKELAKDAVNPQLFTIATLTGHAIRAMGPNYSIIMDNGPARMMRNAQRIQETGHNFGDPFEISTLRRDDFEFHAGKSEYEDVLQANNSPSTMTNRGHQGPGAFLILASGLDKHGVDSQKPLPYSHLDIAGSSGPFPGVPTGSPIVALAAHFLLQ
ncbi:putative aminopeptidase W07G4.4 [Aplysia californica]|uniref:Aminopeptidase W07G4.4 n=1 Tax=Aplysia californica TaxID=6500 RepID=A0ABM1VW66_APLCA|nr:putative aminopeptidase W07G4.4 [Aplysia californica]XP_035826658.1 putative aminopeptidase W07G4.4 [Aplysia californica]